MRWYNDYQIDSPVGQYELLSQFGAGNVTYTPNAEIGEVQLCTLNKPHNNGSHDGAGFVRNGRCEQVEGVKNNAEVAFGAMQFVIAKCCREP